MPFLGSFVPSFSMSTLITAATTCSFSAFAFAFFALSEVAFSWASANLSVSSAAFSFFSFKASSLFFAACSCLAFISCAVLVFVLAPLNLFIRLFLFFFFFGFLTLTSILCPFGSDFLAPPSVPVDDADAELFLSVT